MKCLNCDSEMRSERRTYHYKECGLDNFFLQNIQVFVCDKCGEEEVSIPCVPDLHKVIGRSIVSQKQPLNGKELRFLRKNAGLSATKLSKIIGVRPESISRWENENLNLKGSSDRLIRMIYCAIMEIPSKELKSLVQENFEEISKKKLTESLFNIPVNQWSNENGMCVVV